jgi:hypothetical protein
MRARGASPRHVTKRCCFPWWLLHKPLRYPVRYDEIQRVDFVRGQMSREDLSIAARRPCTASRNKVPRGTIVELARFGGHLSAWAERPGQEGCPDAENSSAVSAAVPP